MKPVWEVISFIVANAIPLIAVGLVVLLLGLLLRGIDQRRRMRLALEQQGYQLLDLGTRHEDLRRQVDCLRSNLERHVASGLMHWHAPAEAKT